MTTTDFSEIDSIEWRHAWYGGAHWGAVTIDISKSLLKVDLVGEARAMHSGDGVIELDRTGEFKTHPIGERIEITFVPAGGAATSWGCPPMMKQLSHEWSEFEAGGLVVQARLEALPLVPRAICVRRPENPECFVYPSVYKAGTSFPTYAVVTFPLYLMSLVAGGKRLRRLYDRRCVLGWLPGEHQDQALESRAAILGLAWLVSCRSELISNTGDS